MSFWISTHSAIERNGCVYVLGGVEANARYVDTIRSAPFLSDGAIGEWTELATTLPTRRGHVHQTPVAGDQLFSLGGRDGSAESRAYAYVGTFE